MSALKTATSALTAAVLVTSIGLAFAQTEDRSPQQSAAPVAATPAVPSEETPADPNAVAVNPNTVQAADGNAMAAQQEPATPPADTTVPLPSASATDSASTTTTPSPAPSTRHEPAPRRDRH